MSEPRGTFPHVWEAINVGDGQWAVIQTSPNGLPIVAAEGSPDHATFDRETAERIAEERNAGLT